MQDIHHHHHHHFHQKDHIHHPHSMVSIGGDGGGGGVSGGGARRFYGGGERRMRPHQSHHNHHQALKCPRCNSLNTKFCYYNNYNLSQPRHFCKSCRRYWTKGGVLRNVPVGGGCRKTKRAKPNKPSSSSSTSTGKSMPDAVDAEGEGKSSASHSSSDSSYLAASAGARPGSSSAAEVASVPITSFGVNNPRLYGNGIEWSALLGQGSSDGGIFAETGSFTSLMWTTQANETTPFGFGGDTGNLSHEQCLDHLKVEGESVNQQYEDRTEGVEFPGRSTVGFEPLDWGGAGGDEVLFDLTNTVDHAYWSQSQWTTDQDHHGLYLP